MNGVFQPSKPSTVDERYIFSSMVSGRSLFCWSAARFLVVSCQWKTEDSSGLLTVMCQLTKLVVSWRTRNLCCYNLIVMLLFSLEIVTHCCLSVANRCNYGRWKKVIEEKIHVGVGNCVRLEGIFWHFHFLEHHTDCYVWLAGYSFLCLKSRYSCYQVISHWSHKKSNIIPRRVIYALVPGVVVTKWSLSLHQKNLPLPVGDPHSYFQISHPWVHLTHNSKWNISIHTLNFCCY